MKYFIITAIATVTLGVAGSVLAMQSNNDSSSFAGWVSMGSHGSLNESNSNPYATGLNDDAVTGLDSSQQKLADSSKSTAGDEDADRRETQRGEKQSEESDHAKSDDNDKDEKDSGHADSQDSDRD